ncbi:MAG: L-rhamnose isomerase [Victivallales bacterium]|nr:L-rhamnose isomerase [Victivallales bacterium]
MKHINEMYKLAAENYAELGIDAERAMARLDDMPLSIHAWQGDDVTGFETTGHALTGGCQVTGNYPGRARNSEELRADLEVALKLIAGKKLRVCLQGHEVDTMFPGRDRDAFTLENFSGWLDWAADKKLGLDIAPAYYSHPKLDHGLSLSHPDPAIREFWINHGIACRRIGAAFARRLGTPAVCNVWVPDGYKDCPADRRAPRERLLESLNATFAEEFPKTELIDTVESKLFGIGVECYTVGSHDFYLTYAAKHNKLICLDTGHFHPTESIADKLSAICCQQGGILLHISRGVRWDSDHVIVLDDALLDLARESVRNDNGSNLYFTLDYFDASINRIAAWVIGARNWQKALLIAMLQPTDKACAAEDAGDFTTRMAVLERNKTLPWNAVWNYYCETRNIPQDGDVMTPIRTYEKDVLLKRI